MIMGTNHSNKNTKTARGKAKTGAIAQTLTI
jgi:hypothetical protein